MGCSSSKRIEATSPIDVYRPAPASFVVFDINSIEEPWLKLDNSRLEFEEKPTHVPAPILETLNTFEAADAPHSWDEVSKALEDLKPTLHRKNSVKKPSLENLSSPENSPPASFPVKKTPRKSFSFHTLEELDKKISSKPSDELKKSESMTDLTDLTELNKSESVTQLKKTESKQPEVHVRGSLKENIFLVRDRLEREKEAKELNYEKMMKRRRDPLSEYTEKIPPNGAETVVLYTTSLGGVRRTFEDCNRVRTVLESHRVVFDERDVSLHAEFLTELTELVGERVSVPRLFVKGRYIGGVDEVTELNELGRLGRIFNTARVEKGIGRQACEGCGGKRFVPCLDCGGSCKVVIGGNKERCGKCNENGLVHCRFCL